MPTGTVRSHAHFPARNSCELFPRTPGNTMLGNVVGAAGPIEAGQVKSEGSCKAVQVYLLVLSEQLLACHPRMNL